MSKGPKQKNVFKMHSLKNSLTCKVFQIQIYFSTMKYVLLKTEQYFQKMHFNIRKSGGRKKQTFIFRCSKVHSIIIAFCKKKWKRNDAVKRPRGIFWSRQKNKYFFHDGKGILETIEIGCTYATKKLMD